MVLRVVTWPTFGGSHGRIVCAAVEDGRGLGLGDDLPAWRPGRLLALLALPFLRVFAYRRGAFGTGPAGGIATPADASLVMQLGAEGVFVG